MNDDFSTIPIEIFNRLEKTTSKMEKNTQMKV